MSMKFRVERDALADAVAWTAKGLPPRPPVPVLAGVLLHVDADRLTVSGFDYEVSNQIAIPVDGDTGGRALVSGRLLAEITRALPNHPVDVSVDGPRVEVTCGSARFTLPTLPVEEYPTLPQQPPAAGTIAGAGLAEAVAQVAVAAGRDDTLPVLTGVRIEIDGPRLTLAATDRYRMAMREIGWRPQQSGISATALVPAKTLAETAKSLAGADEVTLALRARGGAGESGGGGDGIIGFAGGDRQTTSRLLDGEFPKYRSIVPPSFVAEAQIRTSTLVEVVKRVALVAERNTPVRLRFAEGELIAEAGGSEDARASESIELSYAGEAMTVAFNPHYLLDGLGGIGADVARLSFTAPQKPVVITAHRGDVASLSSDYRYVIMPVRPPSR